MRQFVHHQHYQIRNPCEGQVLTLGDVSVTLKVTGSQTNGAFAIFESTVPPHFAGSPAHCHPHATATFYIVSGVLAFTLAEETVMVRQGGIVTVPPSLLHKFWNPTAMPATYLAYLSPAGFEQYFVELAAIMVAEEQWPPQDLRQVLSLGAKYELYPPATAADILTG